MRVLILGVTGMLGHKIYQTLSKNADTYGTIRGNFDDLRKYGFFIESNIISKFDILNLISFETVIEYIRPDVVINCIGIIKQSKDAKDSVLSIKINSLVPHQLYQICFKRGIRIIHISTDCVFSGKKGNYTENDPSDAEDIYGKTKYLGEISGTGALTLRTSIIGRELLTSNGLVEWLISKRQGIINGYTNAYFTGFPTLHLSNIIQNIILNYSELNGVLQISSEKISKYNLLNLINSKMKLNIDIQEYPDIFCDRSLNSDLFRQKTGFYPLMWDKMINEFIEDAKQYQQWR